MTSPTLRAFAAVLVGAAALNLFALSAARAEVTLKDAEGREVKVADTSRIVAIGGDVTEILYALKAEGKIAAVDSTSQYPAQALKEKPNVGYMRALSAEGVLSANPTVIIASRDAGPPDVVAALKASAVPYVAVPDDHTAEGVTAKIRFIAKLVGAQSAGDALAKSVEQDFAALAQDRAKVAKPIRAIFVLTVQNGRATVAGANTSADAVIKLAGAENEAVLPFAALTLFVTPRLVRALNGFLLGEAEAFHLGIDVEKAKRSIVVATAACVGAAVAVSGIIGFVGLVTPHIVRILAGPDHRVVLPGSALLGAAMVLLADVAARMIVRPAELPIGIIMAAIGAPVFLHLVTRRRIGGME